MIYVKIKLMLKMINMIVLSQTQMERHYANPLPFLIIEKDLIPCLKELNLLQMILQK